MKKIYNEIYKSSIIGFLIAIFIIIFITGFTVFAISFPGGSPSGETSGGIFKGYFNKIFSDCGSGKALKGYDTNKDPICVNLNITTPVNCVGTWSDTSTCSVTCGGGFKQQVYTITTPASNGGTSCPSSNGATKWGSTSCNTQACTGCTTGTCGNPGECDGNFVCTNDGGSCTWKYDSIICKATTCPVSNCSFEGQVLQCSMFMLGTCHCQIVPGCGPTPICGLGC